MCSLKLKRVVLFLKILTCFLLPRPFGSMLYHFKHIRKSHCDGKNFMFFIMLRDYSVFQFLANCTELKYVFDMSVSDC